MKETEELLNDFYNQIEKFYDEEILKSKLIDIEHSLSKFMTKKENMIFHEYIVVYQRLNYLENLRLVEYILNKKTN